MAAVMTDLIEDRASHQLMCRQRLVSSGHLEFHISPGPPVSHLRIAYEQQDLACLLEFKGKHETGVVGIAVEIECKLAKGGQPVVLDAPPLFFRMVVCCAYERLD